MDEWMNGWVDGRQERLNSRAGRRTRSSSSPPIQPSTRPLVLSALAAHLPLILLLSSALAASAASAAEAPSLDRLAREMADLVNRDRAQKKLPPLSYRDDLAAVARAHSQDMWDHGFFRHDSPTTGSPRDRVTKAGIPVKAVGENIVSARDVATGHKWLMLSPKHRANILHPDFTDIGIGLIRDRKGTLLITEAFATRPPVYDVEAALKQIVEGIHHERAKRGLPTLAADDGLMKHALAHSRRAARTGKADHLWLDARLAAEGRRWRVRQSAAFLTANPAEVIACEVAQSPRHTHFGVGIVQAPHTAKSVGALWVTLIGGRK